MKHIVAIGGLLPECDNASLLDYSLKLCGKARPTLGYLATARGDADSSIERFTTLAESLNCVPSCLTFFDRTPDVSEWVAAQDVILVGGGNTKSMLAVWREWNLPLLLRQAWERGTVLTGWSAGAICWFEQGVTDSFADRLDSLDCLGLLPGSCCPHYSGEIERRPAYRRLVASGLIADGIAVDDGAGVHFVDDRLHAVVALTPSATAYAVRKTADDVEETPLSGLSKLI